MAQQYQDTMTLTWLSTPEVGHIHKNVAPFAESVHNIAIAPPILMSQYTFSILAIYY